MEHIYNDDLENNKERHSNNWQCWKEISTCSEIADSVGPNRMPYKSRLRSDRRERRRQECLYTVLDIMSL